MEISLKSNFYIIQHIYNVSGEKYVVIIYVAKQILVLYALCHRSKLKLSGYTLPGNYMNKRA